VVFLLGQMQTGLQAWYAATSMVTSVLISKGNLK
jgi:hypothetical protein